MNDSLLPGPDEQRLSFDLLRKLWAAIEDWGKRQAGTGPIVLDRAVMDGLLQTVTAICVSRELSQSGMSAEETQAFLRRLYKPEGLVRAEESDELLRLQARKDVLLAALKRAVSIFPDAPSAAQSRAPEGGRPAVERDAGGLPVIQGAEVYANYRIHSTRLPSGSWIVSLVEMGAAQAGAKASGSRVQRVRGEYASQTEAVLAAKRYIDQPPEPTESGRGPNH